VTIEQPPRTLNDFPLHFIAMTGRIGHGDSSRCAS
jgi:hypothetical protein